MPNLKEDASFVVLLATYVLMVAYSVADCCTEEQDWCLGEENTCTSVRTELFQYEAVEVGHIRFVEVEPGRYVQMKTLALHPPLFEILNFLTNSECEYIKVLAKEKGLEISRTAYKGSASWEEEFQNEEPPDTSHENYKKKLWREKIFSCDTDNDSVLDPEEALSCLPALQRENVTADMLYLMMGDLELDRDSDARLDSEEMWRIAEQQSSTSEDIRVWLKAWRKGEGERMVKRWKGRTRISDQTWLSAIPHERYRLRKIQDRVVALTKLSPEIIYTSEALQVVRYQPGGHYHAHFDSDNLTPELECRHTAISFNLSSSHAFSEELCRFCRLVTVLFYLNDVDGGGETAFPFADLHPDSEEYTDRLSYDYTDLTNHCHDAKVVIKPQRGKAIFWYNHYPDQNTGWLGDRRGHSLHGGCEVTRGVKWLANMWISVDDIRSRHQRYLDSLRPYLRDRAADSTKRNAGDNTNAAFRTGVHSRSEGGGCTEQSKRAKGDLNEK